MSIREGPARRLVLLNQLGETNHIWPRTSFGRRPRRKIVRACSPSMRPFWRRALANMALYRSRSVGVSGGMRFAGAGVGVLGACG